MPESTPLSSLFDVAERFHRSVNLVADYASVDSLEGYILTPLSRSLLQRVSTGLRPRSTERAWSVIGPYGTGKSAASLCISQALGYPPKREARSFIRRDRDLHNTIMADHPGLRDGGFIVIPMVGSRQPLLWTLLAALINALESFNPRDMELELHIQRVCALYSDARRGAPLPPDEVAHLVVESARLLCAATPDVLGMILIIDELGRSLEHSVLNPDSGDISILQSLAEIASRSQDPIIGLITILHQDFDSYAATLSSTQQREWNKIEGRFADVGFVASSDEMLTLVSQAIRPVQHDDALGSIIRAEAARAVELNLLPRNGNRQAGLLTLTHCAPLHPTVSLVLNALVRSRLAQNERSLFAFLSSAEPHGFQEYLRRESWSGNGYRPFYRLDNLYDYVRAALGSGLYTHSRGKHWAEIEEALDRLSPDASILDARLIKVIGLLGILGDQRALRASAPVLIYALADGDITPQEVEDALARLVEQNIATYRQFMDAYLLWQGSDVDLDERYRHGLAHVDRSAPLTLTLQEPGRIKPYIAKRHLHETGTMRFLTPWVVDLEDLEEIGSCPFDAADGAIVFVLPSAGMHSEQVVERVAELSAALASPRQVQTLFAVPQHVQGIRESGEEVAVWEWVAKNTPELEGDRVARRELAARHLAARVRLERATSRCFDPASSYRSCSWVWQGQRRAFDSARELASTVSDACDQAYGQTPIVKNELVNRRSLSTAAAAARRALIERMLTQGDEERLGIEGYPPEASMYLSVLQASGVHREGPDGWWFGPPPPDNDEHGVRPLFEAIDRFLEGSEGHSRPVVDLYEELALPPFGIKEGLLPIYLTAALLHWESEIALYEEGTFVPRVRPAELERLMRAPERFSLQRYRLDETRSAMLLDYARLFNPDVQPTSATVLNSVRALVLFAAQLPRYTQMTRRLSAEARAVRETLLTTREPQPMLFDMLPAALGADVKTAEGMEDYFRRLRDVLLELQSAYERLLGTIEKELLDALRLSPPLEAARHEIAPRAQGLQRWSADLRLQSFAMRLADEELPNREWLESVAAGVANKPPNTWNDSDERGFYSTLMELAGWLRRTEEVALAKGTHTGQGRVIRLGITDADGQERRDVLHIAPGREAELRGAVDALKQALSRLSLDPQMVLGALADLAHSLLDEHAQGENDDE